MGNFEIYFINQSITGKTLLMYLIDLKNEKAALELLKKSSINYNKIDGFGYSALFRAILANMNELSLELIKKKYIHYDLKDPFGYTVLMYSILENMKEPTLKLLKKKYIKYNKVNSDGNTALILSCKKIYNI